MAKKRKTVTKKKAKSTPKAKKSFFSNKKIAVVLLSLFVSVLFVYSVNYFGLQDSKSEISKQNQESSTDALMQKMKKMLDDEKKRLAQKPLSAEEKNETVLPPLVKKQDKDYRAKTSENIQKNDNHFSEIKDYKKSLEYSDDEPKKSIPLKPKREYTGKPRLAIIIDDVAFAHQTRLIKEIPYKITPSFFPPTENHPDTVSLSQKFPFAMVHLPLEALSHSRPEVNTLRIGHSKEFMQKRIKSLIKLFPNSQYYNNHTGSKFTANYRAMSLLMDVMIEEGIIFVDSRTTANTAVPKIAQEKNIKLLSRDIFLDNSIDKNAIKKQLSKAVKVAKRHGYALAIGHPHRNTLQVLKESKSLLNEVELVYVKDI